jgi:RimJ/RimL family protein N-acetyltransferase
MTLTLRRWSPEDLPVLERANTPQMTRYLGGPETPEQLVERHPRYLRLWESGEARMFRIDVDGVPAGSIGWWRVEHDGRDAYETGWGVEPEWQGQGIATRAFRLLIADVRAEGTRHLLVAYPGVDNPGSNALCRRAGFTHTGSETAAWRCGELTFNIWELDMSPLDLAGREPDVDERFAGSGLEPRRWWPYYTPHWSSRERTAAHSELGPDGLTLRIDADTVPWAPDLDGDIRVSHLQTGQFSGAVGSKVGQHRFRPGLVVREQQPEHRGWLVQGGVIEARMAAVRHPSVMVALWPIGFEERPDDCGEICIAEIFGAELDDAGGWVGVGVKPQNDPRLREDFEKVRVKGDLTLLHDYAVEWSRDRLSFFIDGQWVKTVAQTIDYPVQLMLDVYEFPPEDGDRDAAALPHRFPVAWVRSYPPLA